MLSHCYFRFYICSIFTRSELKTTVTINTEQQNICLNIFFFIKTLIYEVAQSRRVTYKVYCKYVYKVPCNFGIKAANKIPPLFWKMYPFLKRKKWLVKLPHTLPNSSQDIRRSFPEYTRIFKSQSVHN